MYAIDWSKILNGGWPPNVMVGTYMYPVDPPFDTQPYVPPTVDAPTIGWPQAKAKERIECVMRQLDEFEVMRALDALDDETRKRVLEWLKKRVG